MPTIVSHALIPLAAGTVAGRRRISARLAMAGALLAMLPDLDVIGFRFGIGYASDWGHRGFTHSLVFAGVLSALVVLLSRPARRLAAWLFLFACIVSHPLLDMLTDGGQGVMLFWPFDRTRYFLPWHPIRVSPIGTHFFSARGLETIWSELILIWLPAGFLSGISVMLRARRLP